MVIELYAQNDSREKLILSFHRAELSIIKAEVETLLSQWEDEIEDYFISTQDDQEFQLFESKILPGFEEGDNAVLKIDGVTKWMYTDRWERYEV